ncbi:MAG TPA: hypothetical protein P5081_07120 [Phycisphaerae bacterium]|nr:hypothetical protein [Phycisphaerae bacterium]HRW52641.1 hypothetical protein [Phycisphaerae bacterium]
MNAAPSLTDHERRILEIYLSEVSAASRGRGPLLTMAVFALLLGAAGVVEIRHFWSTATEPFDVSALAQSIDIPDDAPPRLWAVAEVRRTASLLHTSNQTQMLAVAEASFGLLMLIVSTLTLIWVWGSWRRAERNAILAKVGRWQLEQWRIAVDAPTP